MSAAIAYRAADLDILRKLEETHFWFRARRRIVIDALGRWFPEARNYLEIGSGTGRMARAIREAFPDLDVVASDALARNQECLHIDALDIPFRNAFDTIGAFDVLEHIENDHAALGQMRKACRPGGGILLTAPQHPWLWSDADVYAQHYRRYSRRGLCALLPECGFTVVGCTSFHSTNLPVMIARNALLRFVEYRPETKPPAPPVDRLLEAGMELDRRLISAGLRLPFGSSLMVAARRAD